MRSIRSYMVSLMKDERKGFLDVAIKGILCVLSWAYAFGVKVVDWTYKSGLRKEHKVNVPVISIGNITLGGTGKTPFAVYLADHFVSKGRRPAVLTRGYGKDESRMLKDELPEVSVYVGQDRVKNARWATEQGMDVLILDDGFQHRRISRNLNILMLDSVSMFGNGRLVPRGILREPLSSVERADIFALTKIDRIDEDKRNKIIAELGSLAPGKPVIMTRHKPYFITDVTGAVYAPESIRGDRVILVSGIVDHDYFAFLIENLGAEVAARLDYTDHYRYTQRDINDFCSVCQSEKADKIIVTEKDYVKIKDLDTSPVEDKLFVLKIAIDIVEGKERLIAGLDSVMPR